MRKFWAFDGFYGWHSCAASNFIDHYWSAFGKITHQIQCLLKHAKIIAFGSSIINQITQSHVSKVNAGEADLPGRRT